MFKLVFDFNIHHFIVSLIFYLYLSAAYLFLYALIHKAIQSNLSLTKLEAN